MNITSKQVAKLLAEKHENDVYIPECKNGPSQNASHLRLDAWVMRRSWSNPLTIGYEIKVARADFLNDQKWRKYLPYCNEFYFVAPPGLIDPKELPAEAGIIVTSKHGKCLYTKKKAPRRESQIPESFWRYIVMCRAKITADNTMLTAKAFWQSWMEGRADDREFGHMVSRKIRDRLDKEVRSVKVENKKLAKQIEGLEAVRKFCEEHRVEYSCGKFMADTSVRRKRDEAMQVLPPGFVNSMQRLKNELETSLDQMNKLQNNRCHSRQT